MVQKNNSKILRRFGYFNKVFSPFGCPWLYLCFSEHNCNEGTWSALQLKWDDISSLASFFAHSNPIRICCTELTSLQQWWMKFKLMRIISFEVIRKVDELCIKHKNYSQFLIFQSKFSKRIATAGQVLTTFWVIQFRVANVGMLDIHFDKILTSNQWQIAFVYGCWTGGTHP